MSDQLTPTFGSKWEDNYYRASLRLKRAIEWQVPFFGGWRTRGGTVVDFIDTTPGQYQPAAIFVDGPHWHRNKTGKELEDRLKRARLEKIGYRVLAIEDEAETLEGCVRWIKENL